MLKPIVHLIRIFGKKCHLNGLLTVFLQCPLVEHESIITMIPDSKVHGANMGPTWVLSAPGGPHVGPMNFAIWDRKLFGNI